MKPVFIIGNGRSGTTMLGQLLSSLTNAQSFESHYMIKAYSVYNTLELSKNQVKKVLDVIYRFESSKAFNVRVDLDALTYPVNAGELFNRINTNIANDHGKDYWIDKTPFYITDIPTILKLFPEAKIIWCLRDGRDVALSVFKKSWGANTAYQAAKDWVAWNFENISLQQLPSDQLFQFRYEDFLSAPAKQLTDILAFLGQTADHADIEHITQSVRAGNMNKWKQSFSTQQIRAFESVAFEYLVDNRFETYFTTKPILPIYVILFYQLEENVKKYMHLFKENVMKPLLIKIGILAPFAERD